MTNNLKNKPFFSIITVNLNSGEAILKTLASIKEQENNNFEHIVIDGASTDVSYEILHENLETFDYFCSEKDEGIYGAINKGILKAKGEYLILLHSGDYFNGKATLNDISEYILKNPSYDVYLSDVLICSESSFLIHVDIIRVMFLPQVECALELCLPIQRCSLNENCMKELVCIQLNMILQEILI